MSNPVKPETNCNPLITVCVLNWNRKDALLEALESVRNQTYRPIDMLVVDNGSTDGSADAVEREFPEARVVRLDKNYGCPGGRNKGIENAKGEFVFFLDDDGLLHEEAVERAYKAISSDDRIAVVASKMIYCKTGEERFGFNKSKDLINESFFASVFYGWASLHRASIYKEVGGYPDDYMFGGEEWNLSLRLLNRRYLILYEPGVIMYHKVLSPSSARGRRFLHQCSNTLATAWQLYPMELACLYTIYSMIVQPLRALRNRVFLSWLVGTPRRMKRVLRVAFLKRSPIRRKTFLAIYKLQEQTVKSAHDVFVPSIGYGQYLMKVILKKSHLSRAHVKFGGSSCQYGRDIRGGDVS